MILHPYAEAGVLLTQSYPPSNYDNIPSFDHFNYHSRHKKYLATNKHNLVSTCLK